LYYNNCVIDFFWFLQKVEKETSERSNTFHVALTDLTSCYSESEINYLLNGVRA